MSEDEYLKRGHFFFLGELCMTSVQWRYTIGRSAAKALRSQLSIPIIEELFDTRIRQATELFQSTLELVRGTGPDAISRTASYFSALDPFEIVHEEEIVTDEVVARVKEVIEQTYRMYGYDNAPLAMSISILIVPYSVENQPGMIYAITVSMDPGKPRHAM